MEKSIVGTTRKGVHYENGGIAMKKVFVICMLLFLTGCAPLDTVESSAHITDTDVVEALQNHHIDATLGKFEGNAIFTSKLNGQKPVVYEFNQKWLVIYEFDTPEDREKGEKEFVNNTASMDFISYKSYVKRNILLYYVHGEEDQVPFESEIQQALDSLIEG